MEPAISKPEAPSQPVPQMDEKKVKEIKEKLEQLKKRLDKFKAKVLEKFDEYVVGISLLPPEKPQEGKKESEDIPVLVLVDDSDVRKMTKWELRDKIMKIIDKMAEESDKQIKPEVMLLSELREACFDAKYDVLQLISLGALIHDPKDVLKALKLAEIHKSMVLKKFEKYVVSYVAVGSLFRGDARSNDIDVAVIIDDTDVKKMSRIELRDKLGAIIRTMGYDASDISGVKKSFHIQVYILTDFWDSIKEASPVIFTFLRDGIPLYDRGVFMPWRLLLEMGRVKPSQEAIDMHFDVGERLLERAKGKLLSIAAEDIYYAALNPAQSVLMLYGLPPPTPRETIKLMEEIFVKKEKMLEQKYVDLLAKVFQNFKDIEHGKVKEISGKDLDQQIHQLSDYLKRLKQLVHHVEKKTEKSRIVEFYDMTMKIVQDVLDVEGIKASNPLTGFKQFVAAKKFPKSYEKNLQKIMKIKDNYKSFSKQEIEKLKRENASFLRALIDHIQRKRGEELERAKISIKYGDKFGEVYLFDDGAFIIEDIDAKEKVINKAKILPNGSLGELSKSNLQELEAEFTKARVPKKVFVKGALFETLKEIYGQDLEVLVHY